MGREVRARIEQLREKMAERGMDAYLIPTSDFHGSEYVSGYFKCRKYMTGFTGSAGTAVITMEDAGLWTDGRYFLCRRQQSFPAAGWNFTAPVRRACRRRWNF